VGVAVRGETSMHHRPHWSYSAISQYLSCPLRFFFQRIQRLPQTSVGSSLVLGSSVHAALAEYHRTVQQDEPTDTGKLHRIISETWTTREKETSITYRAGENQADLLAQGVSLVELYLKEPPPDHIIGIEQEIIAPLHNSRGEYLETPLVAVADLITEGNEEITVQEFKTSGRVIGDSYLSPLATIIFPHRHPFRLHLGSSCSSPGSRHGGGSRALHSLSSSKALAQPRCQLWRREFGALHPPFPSKALPEPRCQLWRRRSWLESHASRPPALLARLAASAR
jgi:hypothetical protein